MSAGPPADSQEPSDPRQGRRYRHFLERLEREVACLGAAAAERVTGELEFIELALHDLQNAVTLLDVSMEFLQVGATSLSAEELAVMRDARLAARRIQRYVDHLVTSERVLGGSLRVRHERVLVAPILAGLVEELGHQAGERGLRVTLDFPDPSRLIALGDEVLLTRVMQNLLENAILHGPPGGRVHVTASCTGAVELRFLGDGAPLDRDTRERIFQKYGGGPGQRSGLGLYFCRAVIDAHGGLLAVEDDPTWPVCFALRLPAPPRALT